MGNAGMGKRKKENEGIFVLSRACHAVLREKILSLFFPPSLSLPPLISLRLSSPRRAATPPIRYELCMRENVKLYDVYIRPARPARRCKEALRRNPRIYYMLFN